MKLAKISAALGFAHLLGLSAAAARAEEDEDKKQQRADESDEDYAKRMEEEDKKDGDGKDEKGAKKADEGGDGTDGDDKDESKGKAKGKAEGDDKDKDKDEEGEKEKAARQSERARCAAIFASPAAGVRPDMAAHLAFNTDLSAKAAVDMLGAFAAGGAPARNLASRMADVKTPNVGASAPAAKQATGAAAAANMIIEAGKKRRGEA